MSPSARFTPDCRLPPPNVPADEKLRRRILFAAAAPPGGMPVQRRPRRRAEAPRTTRSLRRGGTLCRFCWPPVSDSKMLSPPAVNLRRGDAGTMAGCVFDAGRVCGRVRERDRAGRRMINGARGAYLPA